MHNEGIKSSSKAVTSELNYGLKFFSSKVKVLVLGNGEYSAQMALKNIRTLTVGNSETIFQKMTAKKLKFTFYSFQMSLAYCSTKQCYRWRVELQKAFLGKCKEFCMYICMNMRTFLAKGLPV